MREIREVFRLRSDLKFSMEKIARALKIGETTVRTYLKKGEAAGLTWPFPEEMSDEKLEELLYSSKKPTPGSHTHPDCEYIDRELHKKGVTLQLLWKEYYSSQTNPYCYSRFCQIHKDWCQTKNTSMIQVHKTGENTFLDYAGATVPIYSPLNGKVEFEAQIFVAVLGASSYIYCEATKSQTTKDWISSHRRMNKFFGGVTECWVPDNLKAGVTKADKYEPVINLTYYNLAQHYGTSVIPARARKPKDKSKVESAVRLVTTSILAPLRNQKFFCLDELNLAIKPLLEHVNHQPFQENPGSSRYSLYEEMERLHLRPLPEVDYEMFYFGNETLKKGYHITIDHIPYSVPHTFVGKSIEFRHNERIIEFFYKGTLIAIHPKSFEKCIPITKREHQPIAHQMQADCTPEKIMEQAKAIGAWVFLWVETVFGDNSIHIRNRVKITLGLVRLSKSYSPFRLNAACERGIHYNNFSLKSIQSILEKGLDQQSFSIEPIFNNIPQEHSNVRGANYYA